MAGFGDGPTFPNAISRYDKYTEFEAVTMAVACAEGDPIHIRSTGLGELANATDNTKPAHGFASRAVSAADITAGGNRAKASLYTDCIVNGGSAGVPGAPIYLTLEGTLGACLTEVEPTTAGNAIQTVGVTTPDGKGIRLVAEPLVAVFQDAAASTAGLA